VLKTELSIEPIRADSLVFLGTQNRILHLEFQTRWPSQPPIEFRMLDYWVRLYRQYQVSIIQVVIVLLPPTAGTVIQDYFQVGETQHRFRVVSLWEQDPQLFLNDPALLPLAPLAATSQPEALLRQVAAQIGRLESEQQRQELSTYTQIFAGLKFKQPLIRQIFREGMMRESVIYQEILQEGRQVEASSLILRQLNRRCGVLTPTLEATIRGLAVEQLEGLAEALLDFSTVADLEGWLGQLGR